MDDTSASIFVGEEEKERILSDIGHVVSSWGLQLPQVSADILSFGYGDYERFGLAEFNINNNVEEGYCGKLMFMFAGQTCPTHHHRIKHETFFVVKGRVSMELNGAGRDLDQGDILAVNRNARHRFTAREDSLILECSKPDLMEDSIFEDETINRLIRREAAG